MVYLVFTFTWPSLHFRGGGEGAKGGGGVPKKKGGVVMLLREWMEGEGVRVWVYREKNH